ncbi:MAG TPA: glycosyltransferase, partial [Ilumatobacteraceae bacterium]
MPEPSVSIIITNHNYAQFLDAAIGSALAQDGDGIDVEVIVVDDGSTDDSLDVIARYGDRIMTIATANDGQGA